MRMTRVMLVLIAIGAIWLTGCGGIGASHSVSPLGFFLPGIVQASPVGLEQQAPLGSSVPAPAQKI